MPRYHISEVDQVKLEGEGWRIHATVAGSTPPR